MEHNFYETADALDHKHHCWYAHNDFKADMLGRRDNSNFIRLIIDFGKSVVTINANNPIA